MSELYQVIIEDRSNLEVFVITTEHSEYEAGRVREQLDFFLAKQNLKDCVTDIRELSDD